MLANWMQIEMKKNFKPYKFITIILFMYSYTLFFLDFIYLKHVESLALDLNSISLKDLIF